MHYLPLRTELVGSVDTSGRKNVAIALARSLADMGMVCCKFHAVEYICLFVI